MSQTFDVAIIGAGIVGLATALKLGERRVSIVVLETELEVAQHQTGHNSGVIHSGLYYKPGSHRARNCAVGRDMMYRFCEEYGIPHERCGKVVVATREDELPALAELERRGRENGLTGIVRLDAGGLKEREPHVVGVAGLWVPETGIVDYKLVAAKYAELIRGRGHEIRLGHRFIRLGGSSSPAAPSSRAAGPRDDLILETTAGPVACRNLINCGGLQSDRVARLCGHDPGLQIVPFRGEYYQIIPERQHLVKNLIYPVPDPRFPFLGVHFTRTVHGEFEAGPNAVLALAREGYSWSKISPRDLWQLARYRGFWSMAGKFWKTGLGEMHRSLSKAAFHRALNRLIPELKITDIRPFGAGVRAQALEPTGQLVDDFRFVQAERMIHVLNAPSPAATASLAIGETIAALAETQFGIE